MCFYFIAVRFTLESISFIPNDKCTDSYVSYLKCLSPVEVIRFDYDLFLGRFSVIFDFRSGQLDVFLFFVLCT